MKCRGGLWSASRNQRAADDNNHKLGLCLFFISFLCLHHFISLFPSFSFIIPDTSFHHSSSLHFLFFSAPSGTFSPFLSPSHRFSASSLSSSPRGLFSCLTLYLCLYSVFHFFFFQGVMWHFGKSNFCCLQKKVPPSCLCTEDKATARKRLAQLSIKRESGRNS